MRRERPTLQYSSFAVYRYLNTDARVRDRLDDPTFVPCPDCKGRRRIYDPCEEPDPVEGNKLRNRITCPSCKGTGEGSWKEARQAYQKAVAGYRERLAMWEYNEALRQNGLAKLTAGEKRALGLA